MSEELKRYEITVEASAVYGNQVFACFAYSELDAKDKFNLGECELIDQELEVQDFDCNSINIEESDDISSRLLSDQLLNAELEVDRLRRELDKHKWIDVKDQLPKRIGKYLCVFSDGASRLH